MATYLIRQMGARSFARIDSDLYYRYDESRPTVNIEKGMLYNVSAPGGKFYFCETEKSPRDIVILKAHEPQLRWFKFVSDLFDLCRGLGVRTVVTLGSLYDQVLHTEKIISAIVSEEKLFRRLAHKNIVPVDYKGPSAIHSLIHQEAQKKGLESVSLWCHCPYYLRGATHFGLLSHLGALLAFLGGFELDTSELDRGWKELNQQIQQLIEKNPELQNMVDDLRKAKVEGSRASIKESVKKGDKVIDLKDFL
jgi:proteasome assembly chaperone (PAC2) family protein